MKLFLSITKNTLKDIYNLAFNHRKKIMELSALFIIISVIFSVLASYLITSLGNFIYSENALTMYNDSAPWDVYHFQEISTSMYFLNVSIFALFLLKYKNNIANTNIKHVLQLKDSNLYINWFFGLLTICISELIFYNDIIDVNNYYYPGIQGPYYSSDTILNLTQLDSWFNSVINLFQASVPIITSVLIIFFSLKKQLGSIKINKTLIPILSTLTLCYCTNTVIDSFIHDTDIYLFRLISIPFETPWIYFIIKMAFSLVFISFACFIIAGSVSLPISIFFKVDLTDKAEKITFKEDDEVLDSLTNE